VLITELASEPFAAHRAGPVVKRQIERSVEVPRSDEHRRDRPTVRGREALNCFLTVPIQHLHRKVLQESSFARTEEFDGEVARMSEIRIRVLGTDCSQARCKNRGLRWQARLNGQGTSCQQPARAVAPVHA
jgi:hypothetical protein